MNEKGKNNEPEHLTYGDRKYDVEIHPVRDGYRKGFLYVATPATDKTIRLFYSETKLDEGGLKKYLDCKLHSRYNSDSFRDLPCTKEVHTPEYIEFYKTGKLKVNDFMCYAIKFSELFGISYNDKDKFYSLLAWLYEIVYPGKNFCESTMYHNLLEEYLRNHKAEEEYNPNAYINDIEALRGLMGKEKTVNNPF